MAIVTLAEAKAHLRVYDVADDTYITGLTEVAEDHLQAQGVAVAAPVPASIRHAALLIIGHFFNNREASSAVNLKTIPHGVEALIAPYREAFA